MDKTASCHGVHGGGIRRNARISAAMPVDLGIDPGVLAAEVAKFVAAEEQSDAPRQLESEGMGIMMRGARISVAKPVDLGIDPGVLAAAVAEFVAAPKRRQACESEVMVRSARISVAGPMDLGVDPGVLAAGTAEFVAAAERQQASRIGKRARKCIRARPTTASSECGWKKSRRGSAASRSSQLATDLGGRI